MAGVLLAAAPYTGSRFGDKRASAIGHCHVNSTVGFIGFLFPACSDRSLRDGGWLAPHLPDRAFGVVASLVVPCSRSFRTDLLRSWTALRRSWAEGRVQTIRSC